MECLIPGLCLVCYKWAAESDPEAPDSWTIVCRKVVYDDDADAEFPLTLLVPETAGVSEKVLGLTQLVIAPNVIGGPTTTNFVVVWSRETGGQSDIFVRRGRLVGDDSWLTTPSRVSAKMLSSRGLLWSPPVLPGLSITSLW